MTATTANFGWTYVDSPNDEVSAKDNFAHVPAIDKTLAGMFPGVLAGACGVVTVNPTSGQVTTQQVTYATALPAQATYLVVLTALSSRPDSVASPSYTGATATGFSLHTYRGSSTTAYNVSYLALALRPSATRFDASFVNLTSDTQSN